MDLQKLQSLLDSQTFHHATYRNIGNLWEGLWIYRKALYGFRGFEVAGCFPKNHPDLEKAFSLVGHTGISIGAYGNG